MNLIFIFISNKDKIMIFILIYYSLFYFQIKHFLLKIKNFKLKLFISGV